MTTTPGLITSVPAAAANTPERRFIRPDGSVAAAAQRALGVSADGTTAVGQALPVMLNGIAFVETGGAFSANASLQSDASGRAIVAVDANPVNAIALEASTAAGQFVRVKIF